MEEDASHTERSSATGSTHTLPLSPLQIPESTEILVPSFSPGSAPSSPTPTGTLSRLGMTLRGQASSSAGGAPPGSPTERGQVSAITVVALLDKLVNMLEAVQENQQRMEQRQADLEGAVRVVQGDVSRLSKSHLSTSNNVNKLLERSRKVSGGVKEVKERLDKQAVQVKKLEANHNHLLKRNHFKVLIFQEDNEIPTDVFVKDSLKAPHASQFDAESTHPTPSVAGSIDTFRSPEEGLQTVSLSSDEDEDLTVHREEDEMLDPEAGMSMGSTTRTYERRADRFKRSSLKKVDSLKKAFSRQSIEKKVNKITTKIVPPERREKIMKSLTPNHPKSPTSKSSSFKVSPMTFNVKKMRDGEVPSQEACHSAEEAHVEIPSLGNMDGEIPLPEVHNKGGTVAEIREALSPSSIKVEVSVNGEAPSLECGVNGDDHSMEDRSVEDHSTEVHSTKDQLGSAGLAVPESVEDVGEEEEEEDEALKAPVENAAEAKIPTANIAVEQAS